VLAPLFRAVPTALLASTHHPPAILPVKHACVATQPYGRTLPLLSDARRRFAHYCAAHICNLRLSARIYASTPTILSSASLISVFDASTSFTKHLSCLTGTTARYATDMVWFRGGRTRWPCARYSYLRAICNV